jgi:hypothetical protein
VVVIVVVESLVGAVVVVVVVGSGEAMVTTMVVDMAWIPRIGGWQGQCVDVPNGTQNLV